MRTLQRRLAKLERCAPQAVPRVTAVALHTGAGDLALTDGVWQPCPDAEPILARCDLPLKVYVGFDPREICQCP